MSRYHATKEIDFINEWSELINQFIAVGYGQPAILSIHSI